MDGILKLWRSLAGICSARLGIPGAPDTCVYLTYKTVHLSTTLEQTHTNSRFEFIKGNTLIILNITLLLD